MPDPDQETTSTKDRYRSAFADDPVLRGWGARSYWLLLGAFVAYDVLVLCCALAALSVSLWVVLVVAVAAQVAFARYASGRLANRRGSRGDSDSRPPT